MKKTDARVTEPVARLNQNERSEEAPQGIWLW